MTSIMTVTIPITIPIITSEFTTDSVSAETEKELKPHTS